MDKQKNLRQLKYANGKMKDGVSMGSNVSISILLEHVHRRASMALVAREILALQDTQLEFVSNGVLLGSVKERRNVTSDIL